MTFWQAAAFLVAMMLLLSGCASTTDERTLFDRLEFDDDETGCFRVTGTLDVSASIWASSNVAVSLVKRKGDAPPEC
jgi:hypothetical protein